MNKFYIRSEKLYTVDEVLSKIKPDVPRKESYVDFDGDRIGMNSHRYLMYKEKGVTCVTCGLKGKYFAKEKGLKDTAYHFNLYALDEEGNEVMMTKDHIYPRSLGGRDHVSNYQPMCAPCNVKKGSTVPLELLNASG